MVRSLDSIPSMLLTLVRPVVKRKIDMEPETKPAALPCPVVPYELEPIP